MEQPRIDNRFLLELSWSLFGTDTYPTSEKLAEINGNTFKSQESVESTKNSFLPSDLWTTIDRLYFSKTKNWYELWN